MSRRRDTSYREEERQANSVIKFGRREETQQKEACKEKEQKTYKVTITLKESKGHLTFLGGMMCQKSMLIKKCLSC